MQLSALSAEDADRAVMTYWRQQASWTEPAIAGWRYEETRNLITLTMSGTAKLDWEGDAKVGRLMAIPGAGQTPPDILKRPAEQNQAAPWVTPFPAYKCWATTIRLPTAPRGWRWGFQAEPMNARLGGMAYWRVAGLQDGLMQTVMSRRAEKPEITASEAQAANDRLPAFDNKISHVFLERGGLRNRPPTDPRLNDAVDWSSDAAPCASDP